VRIPDPWANAFGRAASRAKLYDLTCRSGVGALALLNVTSSASARASSTLGNRWP
jgi:hypothetical protein